MSNLTQKNGRNAETIGYLAAYPKRHVGIDMEVMLDETTVGIFREAIAQILTEKFRSLAYCEVIIERDEGDELASDIVRRAQALATSKCKQQNHKRCDEKT